MSNRLEHLFMGILLMSSVACNSKKQDMPEPHTEPASATAASSPTTDQPTGSGAPVSGQTKKGELPSDRSVRQLPYDNKAPSGIEMKFAVTGALGWQDSKGENALVFAQENRIEMDRTIQELQVRHARRATTESTWETVRDFKELVSKCDGTTLIEVDHEAWRVSDLDRDGVGEATFAYTAGCVTSGSKPLSHKVLMIEDGKKYALRGTKEAFGEHVVVDAAGHPMGETHGGEFEADFAGAPSGFQEHAEAVWRATALVDAPETEARHVDGPLVNGEFLDQHKVMVDVDTEELGDVTDCLSIWTFENGDIEFGIELYFDLDHSCSLSGEASHAGANTWVYRNEECKLELVFERDHVELKDESGGCSQGWCGARGNLDGVHFPLKNRREDTKKCGR